MFNEDQCIVQRQMCADSLLECQCKVLQTNRDPGEYYHSTYSYFVSFFITAPWQLYHPFTFALKHWILFSSASTGGLLSWNYVYHMERHIFAAETSWNCGDERKTERRIRVEVVGVCVRLCLLHRVSAYMFVYIYIAICAHTSVHIHTQHVSIWSWCGLLAKWNVSGIRE